jgi:hypothetical protein
MSIPVDRTGNSDASLLHIALMDALTSGRTLTDKEAAALLDGFARAWHRKGWKAGFSQTDTDALHEALNEGKASANEKGVHYTVEERRPDGYPVWEVTRRTRSDNCRLITEYLHPVAASQVADALNNSARHED